MKAESGHEIKDEEGSRIVGQGRAELRGGKRFSQLTIIVVLASVSVSAAVPRAGSDEAGNAMNAFKTGVQLQNAGHSAEAIAAWTIAINSHGLKNEDAARAMFDRGVAYDSLGNTRQAIADYTAALNIDPNVAAALNNRANVYRRLGRLNDAKRDYVAGLKKTRAARQYPFYGLGLIALAEGDRETARDYFLKSLAVDSHFAIAVKALAGLARAPLSAATLKPPSKAVSASTKPKEGMEAHVQRPALRPAINDSGGPMIQLGAYREEASALAAWNKIADSSNEALNGMRPIIIAVNLRGKGQFWRLRTIVAGRPAGAKLCTKLQEVGHACMLAPP